MLARIGTFCRQGRAGFDWYVDSVHGVDGHTGKSASAALRTIAVLLARPLVQGQRIGLACGSHWREQLTLPQPWMTVAAYGAGAMPLIDASDVIPAGSWSKTAGQMNVYQVTVTLTGTLGNPWFLTAWENDVRFVRVASLAACDATPGSCYVPDESGQGQYTSLQTTLYLHASDGSNPGTNGNSYEYSSREACVCGGPEGNNGITLIGLHVRRNLHCNGAIGLYRKTRLLNCVASEGNKHCIYVGPGSVVTNCEADRGYYTSDAFMMVYNGQGLAGENVTFTNCYCHDQTGATGDAIGGHSNDGTKFGTVTLNGCRSLNTSRFCDLGDATVENVINCSGAGTATGSGTCYLTAPTCLVDGCTFSAPTNGNPVQLDGASPATITIQNCTLTGGNNFYSGVNNLTLNLLNNSMRGDGYLLYFNGTNAALNSSGNTLSTPQKYYYFEHAPGTINSDHNTFTDPAWNQFEGPGGSRWDFAGWQAAGHDTHSTSLFTCDWYVNANSGNDGRGGRAPNDPLQTLAGLRAQWSHVLPGQRIGFAAGGTYTGYIDPAVENLTFTAYSVGAMPVLDRTADQPEAPIYVNAFVLTVDGLHLKGGSISGRSVQIGNDGTGGTLTLRNCVCEGNMIMYTGRPNVTFVLQNSTFTSTGVMFYINGANPSFSAHGNTFSLAAAGDNMYYFANLGFGTIDCDYNTFNPAGTIIRFRGPWDGTHHWTLAEWQAAGHDVHSTLIG